MTTSNHDDETAAMRYVKLAKASSPFDELFSEDFIKFGEVSTYYRYKKTDEGYTLEFDVPGAGKNDVTVSTDGKSLFVNYTVYNLDGATKKKQQVTLPCNIDFLTPIATVVNGILTVKFNQQKEIKTVIPIT